MAKSGKMLPPWLGYVNGKGDVTVTFMTVLSYIRFLLYRLEGETPTGLVEANSMLSTCLWRGPYG